MKEKILAFAQLVETEQIQHLRDKHLDCKANLNNARVHVHDGKKYVRVDIGNSGRYMVEWATGNIYGVKAYGVVHKGHFYGTVDTIGDWNWGDYYPTKKVNPTPLGRLSIPKLTFAPKI